VGLSFSTVSFLQPPSSLTQLLTQEIRVIVHPAGKQSKYPFRGEQDNKFPDDKHTPHIVWSITQKPYLLLPCLDSTYDVDIMATRDTVLPDLVCEGESTSTHPIRISPLEKRFDKQFDIVSMPVFRS
jgi:hypothetical protein